MTTIDPLLVCGDCADALKAAGSRPVSEPIDLAYGTLCSVHPTSVHRHATNALVRHDGWEDTVAEMRRAAIVRKLRAPVDRVGRRIVRLGRAARVLLSRKGA